METLTDPSETTILIAGAIAANIVLVSTTDILSGSIETIAVGWLIITVVINLLAIYSIISNYIL